MCRIFICQFEKSHTTSVALLFHTSGGQDRIDHLVCTLTDLLRPVAEAIAVPLQILLVIRRHMVCNGRILTLSAIQPPVGSDPVLLVKYFNRFVCYPHIDFVLDMFVRNRV